MMNGNCNVINKKYLLTAIFFLNSVFTFARPPAQFFLYLPAGERYVLAGNPRANNSDFPYSNRFEIEQNELFAIISESERRFLRRVYREYKLKVDGFTGFIIFPQGRISERYRDELFGITEIYEHYYILKFENGNLTGEINMNNVQFIEFRAGEFERYVNNYFIHRVNARPETDFWINYFIKAFISLSGVLSQTNDRKYG